MRFITEVREKIACFGRLITSISPMVRGSTPLSEDRKRVFASGGKAKEEEEKSQSVLALQTCQNLRT